MFAGHFAAGLALKAREPRAPTWGLLVGAGLLDLLFGPFVLVGLERVRFTPGIPPGLIFENIDWSHSLLMSVVWALCYALCFVRLGRRIALIMGVAVVSHVVLDWFVHLPDLALWPGSRVHVGLGLWQTFPVGWWFFELAFIGLCLLYYYRRSRALGGFGHRVGAIAAVILVLHLANSPWLMKP